MLLLRMPTIFLIQLALSIVVFFGGSFRDTAQTTQQRPTPAEKNENDDPAEDKIYSSHEVDVRAKLIRGLDDPPSPGADCRGRRRLVVTVRAILRKSGKVSDTELVRRSGCDRYDTDAIRVVSNLKFTPAVKDNQPVSQYQRFEYTHSRF